MLACSATWFPARPSIASLGRLVHPDLLQRGVDRPNCALEFGAQRIELPHKLFVSPSLGGGRQNRCEPSPEPVVMSCTKAHSASLVARQPATIVLRVIERRGPVELDDDVSRVDRRALWHFLSEQAYWGDGVPGRLSSSSSTQLGASRSLRDPTGKWLALPGSIRATASPTG